MRFHRLAAGFVFGGFVLPLAAPALDKPTGRPLEMSTIETEQPIPLAYLSPDGRTAACGNIRLHWSPSAALTSEDDTAGFVVDLPADNPAAATFTAQLWSASLAGSLAWQKPWQGAHWKIFETPETDGTGIDAGLAVGMIATSARRPYPKDTLVIGNLHPDSSLGAVSHLADRVDAAAKAGIARIIIPKTEQFETEPGGSVVDIRRRAENQGLTCIAVDNIVQATEVVMNDPLPDPPTPASPPKYGADVAAYIEGFAEHERAEAQSGLQYAPQEDRLAQYPARQGAVWKQVYAEVGEGEAALKDGRMYVAWRLLARANSRMRGLNALAGRNLAAFDVKEALADSDDLQQRLHNLMAAPSIDRAELQSGLLVAEMADWAYDIQALLEGSELVTKQTFSQRSDATAAERDRAREEILAANEEAGYLLDGAAFYTGLLPHLGEPNPLPANTNAAGLLPQLIPAQLATAQIFTDGIRPQADELRVGLLFDPRLAAYVNVLRDEQAAWNSRQGRKANDAAAPSAGGDVSAGPADSANSAPAGGGTNAVPAASTPTNATNTAPVGFDPGNAYQPPHTEVETGSEPQKKMSDVARCLIWVNTDCEIASLDEKYLRLTGNVDPATHVWRVRNRSQLDTLLQLASDGAQEGAAFAQEAQVSPDLFAMMLERAASLRDLGDDEAALAGLREYWRCALLGNMCWQLAHTQKAAAVDLSTEAGGDKKGKDKTSKAADKGGKAAPMTDPAAARAPTTITNPAPAAATASTHAAPTAPPADLKSPETNAPPQSNSDHVTAVEPEPTPANVAIPAPAPTAAVPVVEPATPPVTTNAAPVIPATNAPPVAPIPHAKAAPGAETEPPVAPVALPVDTNAAPGDTPAPRALPVELPAASAPGTNSSAPVPIPPDIPVAQPAGGDGTPAPAALPVTPLPAATNAPSAIQ